jgi:hypothetical protein
MYSGFEFLLKSNFRVLNLVPSCKYALHYCPNIGEGIFKETIS